MVGVAVCRSVLNAGGAPESSATVANTPPIEVTSLQLDADYEANEVAADAKYKGQPLLLTGLVQSIDKDILDHIVLRLNSSHRFRTVDATLEDGQAQRAAGLAKMQHVELRCVGGLRLVGSASAKDCTIQ